MNGNTARILLMVARLSWLLALGAGVAFWLGWGVPLHAHMGLGGLMVLSLLGVALLGLSRRTGLALALAAVAVLVPVLGMMQLMAPLFDSRVLTQAVHVALGFCAIGLGEVLAKRMKQGAAPLV